MRVSESSRLSYLVNGSDRNIVRGRVMVDGQDREVILPSDIPDSEDLHAHYDFSEYDTSQTSNLDDLSGNGYDLDQGTFTGYGEINGLQAGEFDGVGDGIWSSDSFDDLRPFTLFVVAEHGDSDDATDSHDNVATFGNGSNHHFANRNDGYWAHYDDNWRDGTNDLSNQLFTVDVGDSEITVRENGSETGSGSAGTASATRIGVGSRNPDEDSQHFPGLVGEVLIYETPRSDSQINDVEDYLADKWGVTI